MKYDYHDIVERIHTPESLNDRVIAAAREQDVVPARRKGRQPVWRVAVCAALALALVAGGVSLRPVEQADGKIRHSEGLMIPEVAYRFGLTAYATDTSEPQMTMVNGALAFESAAVRYWSGGDGYYTGCLMQVTGEGIQRITLALDRGEFYRWRDQKGLTEEEPLSFRSGEKTGAATPEEDGTWYVRERSRLGNVVTEEYDPAVRYGFWVQGAANEEWEADPHGAARNSVDQLNGGIMDVTVVFTDGTEKTDRYRLSTGPLVSAENENGTTTLVPALDGAQGSCYGIYAVSETESTWFQWPVKGSNVVSLSNRYGYRTAPGGQEGTFHAGIDIPAEQGTSVSAAAAGAVIETGFDTERGNYLVLDHGDGLTTLYGQCREVLVKEGDTVEAGDEVALVGATGMATGPHLHFEVRQDGEAQNPVAYFNSDIRGTLKMG